MGNVEPGDCRALMTCSKAKCDQVLSMNLNRSGFVEATHLKAIYTCPQVSS